MIEARLFGPPEVTSDGSPIEVDTRKAIALLAYLVVEKTATRETLATILWGDSPPERARATLRRTLSSLRGAAAPSFIEADRSTVSLVGDLVSDVDLVDHELDQTTHHEHEAAEVCERCVPHLRRATAAYRGEFLQGFSVKASAEFDDWTRSVTEAYRIQIGDALHRLGTALASKGDYPGAISATTRWIDLDPLHEPAHRFLMLLDAWAGDRPGAVEAYRNCVAILDQELGVPPLEETTELYEAILDEDLPPAPGVRKRIRPAAPMGDRDANRLIDRGEALGTLIDGLDDTLSTGRFIALTGGAWMGKTRLLEELSAEARARGRAVLIGRAFAMEQNLPFGLATQVLRPALALAAPGSVPDWALGEIGRLVPGPGTPPSAGPPDRYGELRLLESIHTVVTGLASETPLLIVLDDLQWVDSASAAAFSYLARRISTSPILMIGAIRSGGPASVVVTELTTEAGHTVTLGPLTSDDLVEAGVDTTKAQQILERTGGVPLLVGDALATGDGGKEETAGILRYLESRLREVSDLGRQVLTAAAVLNGSCDATLLRETSGRSEDEVVEAVEELIGAGLLREVPGSPTLGFTLDSLEGLVYDSTSLVRRRLLHLRAAHALGERGRASSDPHLAAVIAAQYHAAGDREAIDWYQVAGDLAKAVYAHESAREFYETSLALGNPDMEAVRLALGELAMASGDYEGARRELLVAASHATPASVGVIEHRLGQVERSLGRFKVAEEHFERALGDKTQAAGVLADRALLALRLGESERALALAEEARSAAEEWGDTRQMSRVRNMLAAVTSGEVALEHAEEAMRLAGDDEVLRMAALNNKALLIAETGETDAALGFLREAIAIAERTGHKHREAALWSHMADIHHAVGRESDARDALTRSVSLFAEIDAGVLEPELWLLSRW